MTFFSFYIMIEIGKYHTLEVVKRVDFGLYLDGGEEVGEILLPTRYVPANCEPGDFLEVFIYLDNDERLIATTQKPYAQVGDFACLEVVSVERPGTFLDWGLMKNVFLPFGEQKKALKPGDKAIVYLYVDEKSHRITASEKIEKFTDKEIPDLTEGSEVDLLIYQKTDLGYKAVINNRYVGLIYDNEVFQSIRIGQKTKGFVKQIREDFKIDLSLSKTGPEKIADFADVLLDALHRNDGFLPLTDKSDAETIYKMMQMSKKNFKKAVGNLYKKRIISIEDEGIRIVGS